MAERELRDTRDRKVQHQPRLASEEQKAKFERDIQEFQKQREAYARMRQRKREENIRAIEQFETQAEREFRELDTPGYEREPNPSGESAKVQPKVPPFPFESSRRYNSADRVESERQEDNTERKSDTTTELKTQGAIESKMDKSSISTERDSDVFAKRQSVSDGTHAKRFESDTNKLHIELEQQSHSMGDIENRLKEVKRQQLEDQCQLEKANVPNSELLKYKDNDELKRTCVTEAPGDSSMETRVRTMTVREVSELDRQLDRLILGEQELYRQEREHRQTIMSLEEKRKTMIAVLQEQQEETEVGKYRFKCRKDTDTTYRGLDPKTNLGRVHDSYIAGFTDNSLDMDRKVKVDNISDSKSRRFRPIQHDSSEEVPTRTDTREAYDSPLSEIGGSRGYQLEPRISHMELQRTRECSIKAREDGYKKREIDLKAKQSAIEAHELLMEQNRKHQQYEETLWRREHQIEEKLRDITQRETELQRREDGLYQRTAASKMSVPGIMRSNDDDFETHRRENEPRRREDDLTQRTRRMDRGDSMASVSGTLRSEEDGCGTVGRQSTYPKFSVFSGVEPKPKMEVTFDEWLYEVNCTKDYNTYPEFVLAQAVRKSVRGQAKRVLMPMGTSATVDQMIRKLEGVFGNVTAGESVLQEFYTTSQRQDESVATWGLRLEELLQKAVDKGHVVEDSRNEMLRVKFWKGLRSEKLKLSTRIHYETIKNFERLRREIRAEEHELQIGHGVQHRPMQADEKDISQFEEMKKKVSSLEKQLQQLTRGLYRGKGSTLPKDQSKNTAHLN